MIYSTFRLTASTLVLFSLAACGGGGSTPSVQDPVTPIDEDPIQGGDSIHVPFEASVGNNLNLAAVSLNGTTRSAGLLSGQLDRNANTLELGTLSGQINTSNTQVELSDGGLLAITPGTTEFAARYVATPLNGDRTVGIIGVTTPTQMLPNGEATFTGTTDLTIQDGVSLFSLTGVATVSADFSSNAGTVTTNISDLSGTQTTGITEPNAVSNIGTVVFEGSVITDATFEGGNVSLESSTLSDLSDSVDTSLNGAFFGPSGSEVGATFVIDDGQNGNITAFGTILAD